MANHIWNPRSAEQGDNVNFGVRKNKADAIHWEPGSWWLLSKDRLHEEEAATGKTLAKSEEKDSFDSSCSSVLYLLNPVGIHVLLKATKNLLSKGTRQCDL